MYLDTLLKIKILLDNVEHIQNNLHYNIDLYQIQNTKVSTALYINNIMLYKYQMK